jgi:hypothetical protein
MRLFENLLVYVLETIFSKKNYDYIGRYFSGEEIISKEMEMDSPWKSAASKFDIYNAIFER